MWGYDMNQPAGEHARPMWIRRFLIRIFRGGLTTEPNGAGHQYNALTFQANRTYKSGLTYQFAYTLARDIGDLEGGQTPEDAFNPAAGAPRLDRCGDASGEELHGYELPVRPGPDTSPPE